jgi:hypothetical protein
VHSKGKRAFHPYSEISGEGRIDPRIFTMDGDQVRNVKLSTRLLFARCQAFLQGKGSRSPRFLMSRIVLFETVTYVSALFSTVLLQLSDYDSSYAQQRVDVNSYNAKQQGRQQQYAAEAGSYASAGTTYATRNCSPCLLWYLLYWYSA